MSKFWREALLDIWVLNSFSYLVSLPIEILIADMSWQEHGQVRLVALILNTLVASPFGLWRRLVFNRFQISEKAGFFKVYCVDSVVFLSFQMPLYVGNLVLGGADWLEIFKAGLTITVVAGLLGRPYGLYMDWMRRFFGMNVKYTSPQETITHG